MIDLFVWFLFSVMSRTSIKFNVPSGKYSVSEIAYETLIIKNNIQIEHYKLIPYPRVALVNVPQSISSQTYKLTEYLMSSKFQ